MSIRMLARELYQAAKHVEELETRLRDPSLDDAEKLWLEQEIRIVRAEHDRLRAMLEGAKEGP
jgi:hypothetical protein